MLSDNLQPGCRNPTDFMMIGGAQHSPKHKITTSTLLVACNSKLENLKMRIFWLSWNTEINMIPGAISGPFYEFFKQISYCSFNLSKIHLPFTHSGTSKWTSPNVRQISAHILLDKLESLVIQRQAALVKVSVLIGYFIFLLQISGDDKTYY